MTKQYRVWIEIEEYDTETGMGETLDCKQGYAATVDCDTLDLAYNVAEQLHQFGVENLRTA